MVPCDVIESPHDTFFYMCESRPFGLFSFTGNWCASTTTGVMHSYDVPIDPAKHRAYAPSDKPKLMEFFDKLKKSQATDTPQGREMYVALDVMSRKLANDDLDGLRRDMQETFTYRHPRPF